MSIALHWRLVFNGTAILCDVENSDRKNKTIWFSMTIGNNRINISADIIAITSSRSITGCRL